jgi:hypothetical protein
MILGWIVADVWLGEVTSASELLLCGRWVVGWMSFEGRGFAEFSGVEREVIGLCMYGIQKVVVACNEMVYF